MVKKNELTPRKIKALETRKLLFDTAISLILDKGFNNVHIEDIAREAGTSTGLFYKYFRSKDTVVVEHYKKIDELYLKTYQNLNQKLSSTDKLVELIKVGFIFSENLGKEFLGVLLTNQFGHTEDFKYVLSKDRVVNQIVHEIVEEGQKSGEFRTDLDPNIIVSMVFRCYTGSYFEWTMLEDSKNLTEEGIKFLRLFIESAIKAK